jgi:hypothetical protein
MNSNKIKPNLFIIGAMKSGTSSLHDYLGEHPQIFMAQYKEPMYFSREEHERMSLADYEGLFKDVTNQLFIGESSTEYTKRPQRQHSAERIKAYAPQAKLIYIMRDPFKRSVSHYWHQVKMGREKRSLKDALTLASEYLTLSHYAYQLQPYYSLFGAENIYICAFEEFVNSPSIILNQICSWLNITSPQERDKTQAPKKNVTPEVLYFGSDWFTKLLNTPGIRLIKRVFPGIYSALLNTLPKLSKSFINIKSEAVTTEIDALYLELLPIFHQWSQEIQQLTKQQFKTWPSWPSK